MAEKKPVGTGTKRTVVTAKASKGKGFTAQEKSAMRDRVRELQAASDKEDGETAVLGKIAEMRPPDRALAERLHAVIKASAPVLTPKLWYGMPAYYKDGKALCFFQSAQKFNARYAELGFNDVAKLDEGNMWPVAYALKELGAAEEARIRALLKNALS